MRFPATCKVLSARSWPADFELGARCDAAMAGARIEAARAALCEDYAGFPIWNARSVHTAEVLR